MAERSANEGRGNSHSALRSILRLVDSWKQGAGLLFFLGALGVATLAVSFALVGAVALVIGWTAGGIFDDWELAYIVAVLLYPFALSGSWGSLRKIPGAGD